MKMMMVLMRNQNLCQGLRLQPPGLNADIISFSNDLHHEISEILVSIQPLLESCVYVYVFFF